MTTKIKRNQVKFTDLPSTALATDASGNIIASPGSGGDMVLASAQTNSGLKTFLNGTFGLRNIANTITSLFSSAATVARTYTLQDRDGTLADDTDLALKANLNSPTFTGTVVLPSGQALIAPDLGTPASGVATNLTGTASGLTSGITNALKSATTTVDVSASAAPTTGQVLTATSGTAATWQTPSGGSSDASVLLTNAGYVILTSRTSPTFTVEVYDTDAFHDTSTNTSRIVIPSGKDGKYTFTGNFFTTGGTDTYGFGIQKNGVLVQESKFYGAAAAPFGAGATIVYEDQAVATDYYELSIISSTTRGGSFRFSARKFA